MNALNKYPKLVVFVITVIVVYFLFSGSLYQALHGTLLLLGYSGTFLAGLLYPYSFTSAAGTGILLILANDQNLFLAGAIASVGALISDLLIFLFVKYTFTNEVHRLSRESSIQKVGRLIPAGLRERLLTGIAGVFIASPLPTEIGIMLMTSVRRMSTKKFVVIIYLLHVTAIFVILVIGKII